MSDSGRELVELKREVIEARNQAIKTDNQMKNVALDVKSFEKRFDVLERRTRIASIGVHGLVAATIATAAIIIGAVRQSAHDREIEAVRAELDSTRQKSQAQVAGVNERLRQLEDSREKAFSTRTAALQVLDHLDARRDREAAELLPNVDLTELNDLERRLVENRFLDLRRRTAEAAYRAGRTLLASGRTDSAIVEFARCLKAEPKGSYSERARYLQATTLYALKRYDQAEPLLRALCKVSTDNALLDETRYLLGTALARLGKREEAKKLLQQASTAGRYQAGARSYLDALENGSPLPGDKKRASATVAAGAQP